MDAINPSTTKGAANMVTIEKSGFYVLFATKRVGGEYKSNAWETEDAAISDTRECDRGDVEVIEIEITDGRITNLDGADDLSAAEAAKWANELDINFK